MRLIPSTCRTVRPSSFDGPRPAAFASPKERSRIKSILRLLPFTSSSPRSSLNNGHKRLESRSGSKS
ncbi:hypothetical protein LshimejAT787_0902980 [Lyophyllum shimeji]|uniref:Uncharacterized protein n=1 Tax=Lyophyllum shimeji TaxID=47721 RepID=A0A9P3PS73_LYOSH|nr:hypothetical protein LshimejAT787_0902980 [Lyophyllum shimeji]